MTDSAAHHNLDIPSGIGLTAMVMSLLRNHESRRADALFHEPFGEVVLSALADTQEMDKLTSALGAPSASSLPDKLDSAEFAYFSVRTRYIDDHLIAAMRGGIRQVVSLAAGLDGRAMRLNCPPGTYWYELDLPDVTTFKNTLLEQSTLQPTCIRYGITADVTADWHSPLLAGGFDPTQPTVWLIEGLLYYLAAEVCDQLLASVTSLSVAGSELICEDMGTARGGTPEESVLDVPKSLGASFVSTRDDLSQWLAGHGWQATVHAGSDPTIGYNRHVPETPWSWCWLAHAVLPRSRGIA
jgi:methyltransferase (TIGR00027 family)